jgi:hypothetical protein
MMNETMNRFDRNNAKRAAQRAASHPLNRKDAAAEQAKNREAWTRPTRQSFGLRLDQRTLSAKAAAIAERNTPTAPATSTALTVRSVEAVVQRWVEDTNFYTSEFNNLSLNNRLRERVDAGVPFSYELLTESADWLRRNNHLEQPPNTVRKRGEAVSFAVPTLYAYIPAEEQAAINADLAAKAVENRAKEDAQNASLPLEELRRRVNAGRGEVSRESLRVFQG